MELTTIQHKIYELRGQRVMLDYDLAALYGVETRRLNEQVKRNIERFPEDFMFQLNREEFKNLTSQIATSSWGGMRKLPYAFTELGVAMLSSVLRSEIAIQVNIGIMRAFVSLRHLILLPDTSDRLKKIEKEIDSIKEDMNDILADQNDINESTRAQLDAISQALAELQPLERKHRMRPIGFIQYDKND